MLQKFQEAAEIEKQTKLNQKFQKLALSQDLQRTYEQDHQVTLKFWLLWLTLFFSKV